MISWAAAAWLRAMKCPPAGERAPLLEDVNKLAHLESFSTYLGIVLAALHLNLDHARSLLSGACLLGRGNAPFDLRTPRESAASRNTRPWDRGCEVFSASMPGVARFIVTAEARGHRPALRVMSCPHTCRCMARFWWQRRRWSRQQRPHRHAQCEFARWRPKEENKSKTHLDGKGERLKSTDLSCEAMTSSN